MILPPHPTFPRPLLRAENNAQPQEGACIGNSSISGVILWVVTNRNRYEDVNLKKCLLNTVYC
jgi:hypothetical protein